MLVANWEKMRSASRRNCGSSVGTISSNTVSSALRRARNDERHPWETGQYSCVPSISVSISDTNQQACTAYICGSVYVSIGSVFAHPTIRRSLGFGVCLHTVSAQTLRDFFT